MKLIAINEIHYTDAKSNKSKVAAPGEQFDVPMALAEKLLDGNMPAARRMTNAEIELDKLRTMAMQRGAEATTAADSADSVSEDDTATAGSETDGNADASAVKTEEKTARSKAKTAGAKAGSKSDY